MSRHEITAADIMDMAEYAAVRADRRAAIVAQKRRRRVEVGPVAVFYFENYDTMSHQVHEMLFVERGGAAQLDDELAAYNPLIPKGRELVATVMFEIDEPQRRQAILGRLGGVEETAFIKVADHEIRGRPEADVDRTNADGKASAVQFIHFPFDDTEVAAFRMLGAAVVVGFTHPACGHVAVVAEDVRAALAEDFD